MIKKSNSSFLEDLFSIIKKRDKSNKKDSYTKNLLKQGKNKIASKIGEESSELIVDYLNGSKKRIIEETSDLLYHIMILKNYLLYILKMNINGWKKNLVKLLELKKERSKIKERNY